MFCKIKNRQKIQYKWYSMKKLNRLRVKQAKEKKSCKWKIERKDCGNRWMLKTDYVNHIANKKKVGYQVPSSF